MYYSDPTQIIITLPNLTTKLVEIVQFVFEMAALIVNYDINEKRFVDVSKNSDWKCN